MSLLITIRDSRVIRLITQSLDLPISGRCEIAYVYPTEIIFTDDDYKDNQCCATIKDVWSTLEVDYFGIPYLSVMHALDIASYKIDLSHKNVEYYCYYNRQGKINYGRYYEPSLD